MQVGTITVDGRQIGVVNYSVGTLPIADGLPTGVAAPVPEAPIHGSSGEHGSIRHGAAHHAEKRHHRYHTPYSEPAHHGPVSVGPGDDPRGMESHIREEAKKNNVDPDTAVAVAKSEGLRDRVGDRGTSFGAFQLHTPGGLGDEFRKETGLDPSDPTNEKATIAWAMKNLGRTGWEPYHGAHRVGIGNREGIDGTPSHVGPQAETSDVSRGSANLMHGQYGAPGENLVTIQTPSGKTARVHSDAASSFSGFLSDLEKSGYQINDLGGYNYRTIGGSNHLSQHAYGNAIDINPEQNPQHGGTNLPADVSDMAARHGLTWGGDWSRGSRDPMHFEWTGAKSSGSRGAPVGEPDVGPQSSIAAPYKVATNIQDPKLNSDDLTDVMVGRAKEGMPDTDTRKPGILELDKIYTPGEQKNQPDPVSIPQAPTEEQKAFRAMMKKHGVDYDTPSGFYPPTPGDENDPLKPGSTPGWNIPSDYNQG